MIDLECGGCGHTASVPTWAAGLPVTCRACGAEAAVPEADSPEARETRHAEAVDAAVACFAAIAGGRPVAVD